MTLVNPILNFANKIPSFVEFIQVYLWINSTKDRIVNYKGDFSFALKNLTQAYSR
jgi:hypothetical protein